MSLLTKVRQWIHEERRYIWIVVILVLFHSTFILLEALTAPRATRETPVQKEGLLIEETRLMTALKESESLQLLLGIGTLFVLILLILGLFLAIRFLNQRRQGKWVIPWRLPDQEILWTVRDVFHVIVLLVLASYLIELCQFLFFQIFPKETSGNIRLLGGTLLTQIIALYLILRMVMFRKGQSLSRLGLSTNAFSRNLLFGFKSYLSLLPVLLFLLFVSLWMAECFKLSPPPQPIHDLFKEGVPHEITFFALILVVFLGPMIEEIFFRGFLYNALKVKWGKEWAIFSSGFLFAMLHANLIGLLPIALLGCALAYVYELTGSLVASITIHILHNSLVMAIFFFTTHLFGIA